MLSNVGFRARLFIILLSFALVPTIVLTLAWGTTIWIVLPFANSVAAWDTAAVTGASALEVARRSELPADDSAALARHESTLNESLTRSRQASFVLRRAGVSFAILSVVAFGLLLLVTSRVAGHLSRNLSRPLQEIVGWTEHIARNEPLPDAPAKRGAPEFDVLRQRMRDMSTQIESGRRSALEAERLSALRETARQVAHELKNPLTPIRFAVDRLRREAPPALADTVDVLAVESARLETLARSFSQFGKLPEGPHAPLDLGELARYTARSSVPEKMAVDVSVADGVPLIEGHHEALGRAISNVVLNAVDACRDGGSIVVEVAPASLNGGAAVALTVKDTGCGIPLEKLARIWEPYVTTKPGGTGLGLAIARQTILAHGGDVSAESTPGSGTSIRFLLPVKQREHPNRS